MGVHLSLSRLGRKSSLGNNLGICWGKLSLSFYRSTVFRRLAERRPNVFGGLQEVDSKSHRRLLQSMHPHSAMTMIRLWTGSAMTASHKHRIDPTVSNLCECGEVQDVPQLLYACPLQSPLPLNLEPWRSLEPVQSCGLLCPMRASVDVKKMWRENVP